MTERDAERMAAARERLETAFDNAMIDFADEMITLVSIDEINEFAKVALDNILRIEDDFADEGPTPDEPWDGFRNDVEADADVLRSAGWGTDEDYGYYGGDE